MMDLHPITSAIGGVLIVLGICRFVPIFKCITWCKLKKIRAKYALDQLYDMCSFLPSNRHRPSVPVNIYTEKYTTKQLEKIYKYTTPFGCNSFNQPDWVEAARNLLKHEIADRQLLNL